jgi:hypothetical protein
MPFQEDFGDEPPKLRGLGGCCHGVEEIHHDFAEQIAVGLFRVFKGLDIRKSTRGARLLTLGENPPEQMRLATPDLTQNQSGTVQRRAPHLLLDELPETTKRMFVNRWHIGIGRFPGVAHTGGGKRIVPPEEGKSGIRVHQSVLANSGQYTRCRRHR